jgi:gamma-glutamyl phosphate reductase
MPYSSNISQDKESISMTNLIAMAKSAKVASHKVSTLPAEKKNETLSAIASELERQAQTVLAQNGLDIKDARSSGLSDALVDRLLLTPERIEGLAADRSPTHSHWCFRSNLRSSAQRHD